MAKLRMAHAELRKPASTASTLAEHIGHFQEHSGSMYKQSLQNHINFSLCTSNHITSLGEMCHTL